MATTVANKVQRGPRLRDRRRGRLDPHRRGPHPADHLGQHRRRRQAVLPFASIVRGLKRDVDYEVDEEKRIVAPTEEGVEKVEKALGVDNLYDDRPAEPRAPVPGALKAKELYKRDKDYIIQHGEVKIVDEFTGRILEGRRWSEGLHQAVEAKEGVKIKEENQTLATITLQNYFRMYDKLAGMTGTAVTEAAEFENTYGLQVVPIPTHREIVRIDQADLIYKSEDGQVRGAWSTTSPSATRPASRCWWAPSRWPSPRSSPACSRSAASPTRCSTPSSTPVRPRSSPRPAGCTRSPSPPTWPAVASTSSSVATPRASPSGICEPRAST
jgi:hypothetical protein